MKQGTLIIISLKLISVQYADPHDHHAKARRSRLHGCRFTSLISGYPYFTRWSTGVSLLRMLR